MRRCSLSTLIDIVQPSIQCNTFVSRFEADGTPLVTPEGGFVKAGLWRREHWNSLKELYAMSEHFKALEGLIGLKSRALKAKLDPQLKKEWLEHIKDRIRKYSVDCSDEKVEELESHVLWSLRAVPWMLTYAPPEFFATHREDFGDLADLLSQSPADLPTSSDGATMGPAVLLKDLSFLGRATRSLCLTAEDSKLFKQHCEAVAAEPYFLPHEESFPPRPQ
eukprot:Blabericola_migrator_1__5699@NODE_2893_length_2230_cov_23_706889_g1815_i0_p1_GENE_NODE_2893_length_2230_cov_23_706889_g1815_i0NODE_2893_length_2230_cov_23_706889_g1815_i0_p1_ORF_typecomplete_len221_score31_46WbqC/PF08889_11/0_064_NODE_2893_length_2230_cov_23_706889_g1815_i0120782